MKLYTTRKEMQLLILRIINNKRISIRKLSEKIQKNYNYTARLLSSLQKDKLITKEQGYNDKRQEFLVLTIKGKIELEKLREQVPSSENVCLKCRYHWFARIDWKKEGYCTEPIRCPKCNSVYWNR